MTPLGRRQRALALAIASCSALVTAPGALAAGPVTVTPGPDAQSARVVVEGPDGRPQAEVCFDALVTAPDPTRFALVGYAAAAPALVPDEATVDVDAPRCVRLAFSPSTPADWPDIAGFTLATAGRGAVQDLVGRFNVPASRPLLGSSVSPRRGQTVGPMVLGTTVDATTNEITFEFSRRLDATADGTRFGFYTASGVFHSGAAALVSGRYATVSFATASVLDAVRTAALPGAVRSRTQPLPNDQDVRGGATERPDLLAAQPVRGLPGVYDLTYDTSVVATLASVANCGALLEGGGVPLPGVAVGRPNDDPAVVRVAFAPLARRNDAKLVRIVDQGGCALSNTLAAASSLGDVGLRATNMAPGFTEGPDLEQVDFDAADGLATFRFDQEVDPATAVSTGFSLVHRDGVLTSDGLVINSETPAREIVMQFTNDAIAGSIGGVVAPSAVLDPAATPSPLGAVGPVPVASAATPSPTAAATAATTTTASTPLPAPATAAATTSTTARRAAEQPAVSVRLYRAGRTGRYVALKVRGTTSRTRVVVGFADRKGRFLRKVTRKVWPGQRTVLRFGIPRAARRTAAAITKVL